LICFSIFLPVRNGMPYIKECIDSILNQSYSNFELIVMDNASTDNTAEWVESLDDSRIRLIKSERSLSIQESWGRIKHQSKQEFMTMIGHDDIFDHAFLSIINELIIKNPKASLYQTGSRFINSKGNTIRSCQSVPDSESAAQYLSARLEFKRDVFGTGYVMRSNDYDEIGGIFDFEKLFFADDALWLSLMRKSWKSSDPREAFSVRIHSQSESASLSSAWPSILLGLSHFNAFLNEFIRQDAESATVYKIFAPAFILTYHRNMLIFALIDASRKQKKISSDIVHKIELSLSENASSVDGLLKKSLKVRAILVLNATIFRGMLIHLWNIYNIIKSKSL